MSCVVVVGIAAAILLIGRQASSRAPILATAAVERRDIAETVVTRGVLGYAVGGHIVAAASGRVTALPIAPGGLLHTGEIAFFIDGRPSVVVDGAQPFHRELASGSQGPDVAELQRILASEGFMPSKTGIFDAMTEAALSTWQTAHSFPSADGRLGLNDMIVGNWPSRIGTLGVSVGDFVSTGQELASLTADEPAIRVDLLPSERNSVRQGNQAIVTVPGTASELRGTVVRIASVPTVVDDPPGGSGQRSVVYSAEIEVAEASELPLGIQLQVTIITAEVHAALAVPIAAIVSDSQGHPAIRLLMPDGRIELIPVDTGLSEGAYVEVVGGLSGDETIVLAQGP